VALGVTGRPSRGTACGACLAACDQETRRRQVCTVSDRLRRGLRLLLQSRLLLKAPGMVRLLCCGKGLAERSCSRFARQEKAPHVDPRGAFPMLVDAGGHLSWARWFDARGTMGSLREERSYQGANVTLIRCCQCIIRLPRGWAKRRSRAPRLFGCCVARVWLACRPLREPAVGAELCGVVSTTRRRSSPMSRLGLEAFPRSRGKRSGW
jgi:hypothetical protein